MSEKSKKPNTARLLRDYERAKAARIRTQEAARKAFDAYAMAENKLRSALELQNPNGVYFTTTSGIAIRSNIT